MREIKLTKGKVALVDDEDFEYLNQFKWHAVVCGRGKYHYAARNVRGSDGKQKSIKMHRFLVGTTNTEIEVDHEDRNTLNNQKHNLREGSKSQNMQNRIGYGKSKYLGVYPIIQPRKNKTYEYWAATIFVNGKGIHLGTFPYTPDGEIMAAKRYDLAALEHKKDFANLNFK